VNRRQFRTYEMRMAMKKLLAAVFRAPVSLVVAVSLVVVSAAAAAEPSPPLRIHLIGIGEYKPVESLTAFKQYLEERYDVAMTRRRSASRRAITPAARRSPTWSASARPM
jgi:hypothetical protein